MICPIYNVKFDNKCVRSECAQERFSYGVAHIRVIIVVVVWPGGPTLTGSKALC